MFVETIRDRYVLPVQADPSGGQLQGSPKSLKKETRDSSSVGFGKPMSRAVQGPEAIIFCKSDPRRLLVLSPPLLE